MNAHQLFERWLALDKRVDHDGDAEVTDDEREQWEIEHQLDERGYRIIWNSEGWQLVRGQPS